MADFRAIMAVNEAIVKLLRSNYRAEDFNNELEFKVFTSKDFTDNTISNGVSVFPYRIFVNGVNRLPTGRLGRNGEQMKNKLPLEFHCLITLWGQDSTLQNTLAGWVMRVIEDNPTLHSNLLNSAVADVFSHDESVDISFAELSTEDMFRIWDVLGVNVYQLSIPYLIRVIELDSIQNIQQVSDVDVQTREFQFTEEIEP
jgi:hypothetical protein